MLVPVEVVLEVGDAIQNGSPVGAANVAMLQGTDLQAPALGTLIYRHVQPLLLRRGWAGIEHVGVGC